MGMKQIELEKYRDAQTLAKNTIRYLSDIITDGISERDIANTSNEFMRSNGADFWYHGVGSLVLVGGRTTLSVSGREYNPTSERVNNEDLVTVDLCPSIDGYWGDFARSFIISEGKVNVGPTPKDSRTIKAMFDGVETENKLHQTLLENAHPEMTFEELYLMMNNEITVLGYVNMDFKRNLGHTIEKDKDNRRYIEKGSVTVLGNVLFTFEPHIAKVNSSLGYKMEDIYYFSGNELQRL
jgi:Xaa-Pro aminopeptidase